MATLESLSRLLETYSLPEILEYNDLSEEEVLLHLLEEEYIILPDVLPVDIE